MKVHGALTSVLGEVSCLPSFYKEGCNPKTSPGVFSALKPQQLPLPVQEFKSKAEHGFQLDLQEMTRIQLRFCRGGCLGEKLAPEQGLEVGSVCHLLESFPIARAAGPAGALHPAQQATLGVTTSRWLLVPGAGGGKGWPLPREDMASLLCFCVMRQPLAART